MGDNIVKLVFQASSSGFNGIIGQTQDLQGKLGKLAQGASVLGSAFGQVGGAIGRAFGMFLQGGIWGAAAECIKLIIEKTGILKKTVEETNTALKQQGEHFKTIQANYAKALSAIDKETALQKRQIELTQAQTKAEYDLAIAKAKARGQDEKAVSLTREAADENARLTRQEKRISVQDAERKLAAAKKAATGMFGWANGEFSFDKRYWSKQIRLANGNINLANLAMNQEYEDSMHWKRTIKRDLYVPGEDLDARLEKAKESKSALIESMKAAKKAAEDIADAKQVLADAKRIEATANVSGAAGAIAAQAAAKEDVVKKLQSEIVANAARTKTIEPSTAVGGTFAEHFDLWRDPAAAQAAQDAARKRTDDMKDFYRAVNRYSGKGKIDEAAELMRMGDEEGLQERLAAWRKSSKFTGQTEQMVLAAAAKQNEHAAERSLADIQKSSASIEQKLEDIRKAFEGGVE